ncbi:MAG: HicA protein [Proteobacteria bacterium]|nr:HicA protein [Pseudomonadota bacterium]
MNSKHRKTLAAVFAEPASGTIAWAEIEGLLVAVGCRVIEGAGSRVRFEKDGAIASFHRPHPEKEAKRYQVRDAREFLSRLGVEP